MRVVWIGNPFFYKELDQCGLPTSFVPLHWPKPSTWQELTRQAGFVPDVLILGDVSTPPPLLGVEQFPCLTIFYAVDSHIHSWYPYYAQAFDVCLFSLRDHREKFASKALPDERLLWFPPYAKEEDKPDPQIAPRWDCLFVGTVSAATPGRRRFLEELGRLLPVQVMQGNYRALFPQGRVVLNFCEQGDLNFRVFEALGCGGALVTARVGHGQETILRDGEHCRIYDPASPEDAARCIRALLADDEGRRHMAERGLAVIDAAHRARHRAGRLAAFLQAYDVESRRAIVTARLAQADAIRQAYLRVPLLLWAEQPVDPAMRRSYLLAAQGRFGLDGPLL